jgi:hypothetical protein
MLLAIWEYQYIFNRLISLFLLELLPVSGDNPSPQYIGAPRGRKVPADESSVREIVGSSR